MASWSRTQDAHKPTESAVQVNSEYCEDGSERIQKLLAEFKAAGILLSIESGRLAFDAPAGAMTDERLVRLRKDRDAVLAALALVEKQAANWEQNGSLVVSNADQLARGELVKQPVKPELEDTLEGFQCPFFASTGVSRMSLMACDAGIVLGWLGCF